MSEENDETKAWDGAVEWFNGVTSSDLIYVWADSDDSNADRNNEIKAQQSLDDYVRDKLETQYAEILADFDRHWIVGQKSCREECVYCKAAREMGDPAKVLYSDGIRGLKTHKDFLVEVDEEPMLMKIAREFKDEEDKRRRMVGGFDHVSENNDLLDKSAWDFDKDRLRKKFRGASASGLSEDEVDEEILRRIVADPKSVPPSNKSS